MSTNSASASSASSAAAAIIASNGKIPLTRQRALSIKSGARRLKKSATTGSGSNDIPLVNYNGDSYFADIKIDGSTYTVLVDTGSSDLWVSCSYVSGTSCSSTCPSKSSTITYGSGTVCIQGALTTVQIGEVSVSDYVVGIAYGSNVLRTSSSSLLSGGSQGLLGLAYQSLATIPTPGGQFIDYLTSFSVFLTEEANSDGSFLMLNGVDEDYISKNNLKPYKLSLKEATHWTIGMTAFQVGNETAVFPCSSATFKSGGTSSCRAIVDTGTSLLYMPTAIFNSFVSSYLTPNGCGISDETDEASSVYLCPSSVSLPRLGFTFDDYTFYLEGKDYVISVPDSRYVMVGLLPTGSSGDLGGTWIIGDTFLKTYYTSYATNQSVTFYCPEGSCTEGAVTTTAYPSSAGSTSPASPLFGGSDSGSTSTSDSNDSGLNTTETVLIVAVSMLGAILLLICAFCGVRWRRRRANRSAYGQEPPPPVNGTYYPAQLTPQTC
uniref:Peptidase A1 domain-containing protein n=1 Tax=Globisporangium ultimum (strain ATCC 200006 / CBS 805.95 / DAOM BR144) TaxID=431595 RepID=K3XBY2_GLOUD